MPIAEAFTPVVPTGNPTTGWTVVVPAGGVAGVILELSVTSRDNINPALGPTISDNDTGGNAWALVKQSADGKATTWWKRATSGTAGKTITIASAIGSSSGVLKGWTSCIASGTPQTDIVEESNASGDETHAGFTPSQADSMVRAVVYNYGNDNAVTSLSFATLGATTMTEKLSTGGSDCACASGHKLQAGAAAATGNLTWAQTNGATYSHVWALKPAEEHSGSAALSAGGGITPVIATQRSVAPALSSGGGITPAVATERAAAPSLSAGGGVTPVIATQRNVAPALSSGGGVALVPSTQRGSAPSLSASGGVTPTAATQRGAAPVLAGGGGITIVAEASSAEAHSGSASLSGGGSIATLASSSRAAAPLLSAGGGVAIIYLGARNATALLTAGGAVVAQVGTGRAASAALLSGGGISTTAETGVREPAVEYEALVVEPPVVPRTWSTPDAPMATAETGSAFGAPFVD